MPGTPPTSPRFGAPRYASTDVADFAGQVNAITDAFDVEAAKYASGTSTARLAATNVDGYLWRETDTGRVYLGTGSTWTLLGSTAGASIIAATENVTALGLPMALAPTPDQVSIVLPTNGIIEVLFQAQYKMGAGAPQFGQAAIHIDGNQVQIQGWDNVASHGPKPQAAALTAANWNPLVSFFGGLISTGSANDFHADAATGQIIGFYNYAGDNSAAIVGADTVNGAYTGNVASGPSLGTSFAYFGGPCLMFAAAGTHVVSVRYESNNGGTPLQIRNRNLWVRAIPFS